jgi:hypothetical protein
MMLRALTINDAARAEVARVVANAKSHPYRPDCETPPGDDKRFVAKLDTYRAVFSFTHADGLVYRHLSISVPGKDYPNPLAVFTIADLFGFTGWGGQSYPAHGWMINVNENEHCIVLAQPMEEEAVS